MSPTFSPGPYLLHLTVPVSDNADGPPTQEAKLYAVTGVSYYSDPLSVGQAADEARFSDFLDPSDLFQFFALLERSYKKVDTVDDILAFTEVEDEERFKDLVGENWDKIVEHYNGLESFHLRLCWFDENGNVSALIVVRNQQKQEYTVPMHFTLTEGGWRVRSGFMSKDKFLQDLHRSAHFGDYTTGVVIIGASLPLPEEIELLLPNTEVFAPVALPLDLLEHIVSP